MAVLEDSIQLIRDSYQEEVDLAHLPQDDDAVYRALQKADTIGLFQVESRAQMSCLPRLRPQKFYDIVVQVAIIRPGPIVGNMVHPYLKRRQGREPVVYPHPLLGRFSAHLVFLCFRTILKMARSCPFPRRAKSCGVLLVLPIRSRMKKLNKTSPRHGAHWINRKKVLDGQAITRCVYGFPIPRSPLCFDA